MASTPTRRRRWRWRAIIGSIGLVLVAGCAAAVFVARSFLVPDTSTAPALTSLVVPVEQRDLVESVQVNGTLEPRDSARLGFPANSRVSEVLVEEGDQVRAGDALARLETRDLQLKVASSAAQVDEAQQALDTLLAGPSAAERAKAAARVALARAALASLANEVRPVDIENARAAVAQARKRLADLQQAEITDEGRAAQQQLLGAQDALTAAQVGLEKTRDSASRSKTDARQAMERGAQELEQAQRAYSDAKSDWDYVQRTGRHPREKVVNAEGRDENRKLDSYEKEVFRRTLDDARVAMQNAEVALQNLLETYDQAREDEVRQVQEAERALAAAERAQEDARRKLERERSQGFAEALLAARKELAEAEKAYSALANDPQRPAKRADLEADLLEAIANQEKLAEGSDPVKLAQARTALEEARAALAEAEADLADATLRAPIGGTVVEVTLKAGTLAASDTTITIADLSAFLIRGQVTEQNVANVRAGLPVQVSVDAVPGEGYRGTLRRVSDLPAQQDQSGAAGNQGTIFGPNPSGALGGLYPVEIVVEAADERLRVGMATTASIELFAIPNAVVVPLQAVEQGSSGPFVRKATGATGPGGQPLSAEVPVELGRSSGESVQVLKGLQPGDSVVLNQLPPPEQPSFGPGG